MLINSSGLLGNIRTYRVLWLGGRFGGGKTLLAHRIAYDLLSSGFSRYLLSNVPSVWADSIDDVVLREDAFGRPMFADCCIILDEGGLFLRYGRDADEYTAFLRKMNIVLILPSVEQPARKLCKLSVQRIFNLNAVGLPAWIYKMSLVYGGQRDAEYFGYWRPSEMFGIYNTDTPVVDDNGIGDWLIDLKNYMVDRERNEQIKSGFRKHRTGSKRVGRAAALKPVSGMEGFGGDIDLITDAADQVSDSVSLLASIGGKGRR